jgi:hypothetical protein
MAFRTGRFTRGRNQNKLRLGRILLRRGRQLWEVLQRDIPNVLPLRVSGLLESRVVGSKLESLTLAQARRSLLSQRSETRDAINTRQNHPGKKFDRESYDASRPNFGRIFFPARRGGRLSRGLAGITVSSSSPEEKWVSPRSYKSSTMSVSTTCLFLADVRDGEGAAEADSSRASVKSRPGYSPSSGWGG